MPIICNILFIIIFVNYLVGGLIALSALQLGAKAQLFLLP